MATLLYLLNLLYLLIHYPNFNSMKTKMLNPTIDRLEEGSSPDFAWNLKKSSLKKIRYSNTKISKYWFKSRQLSNSGLNQTSVDVVSLLLTSNIFTWITLICLRMGIYGSKKSCGGEIPGNWGKELCKDFYSIHNLRNKHYKILFGNI